MKTPKNKESSLPKVTPIRGGGATVWVQSGSAMSVWAPQGNFPQTAIKEQESGG